MKLVTLEEAIKMIESRTWYQPLIIENIDYSTAEYICSNYNNGFKYIPEEMQDYNLAKLAVIKTYHAIEDISQKLIDEGLGELEKISVSMSPRSVTKIKNADYNLWLLAISLDGMQIRHYKPFQTEELCMKAVSQNGMAVKFVKNQTEEIVLTAIRQNINSIKHVKINSMKIAREAVKQYKIQKCKK